MNTLIVVCIIALLLVGAPLYISILALGSYLFYVKEIPLVSTVISFQKLETQAFLSAIPLFTFAGYVLSQSKVSLRLVRLSQSLFSSIPGTTSLVVVVIMALFTSLTGASGVSILALGGLIYPLVKQATNNEEFSYGIITASGSIGLLFAPALPAIIYAIIANQNSSFHRIDINTLFFVALTPSFLLIGLFSLYSIFKERKLIKANKIMALKKNSIAIGVAVKEAAWEIPLPFLIYGGIYLGFISVLEAAILTSVYCFILVFFIRKDLEWRKDFLPTTYNSLKLSGGIFVIMVSAFVLTNYIINEHIPDKIFDFLSTYIDNKYSFLLLTNVFLLIVGCLLDIFSAILIILPLLIPLVEKYGIDPYHFAIIFLVNLEIGYLTPPVGLNLFIASFRFKKSILYLYKCIIPFFAMMLIALGIVTYVPAISVYLLPKEMQTKSQNTPPPQPKKITIVQKTSQDLTLKVELPKNFSQGVQKIVVHYIDEKSDDAQYITDFGFVDHFAVDDSAKDQDAAQKTAKVTVSGLSAGKDYSIIIMFISNKIESVPSEIIQTQTTPQ